MFDQSLQEGNLNHSFPQTQYPISEELLKYEQNIHSNNFNAFDLQKETKGNALYFMLQYAS